MLRTLPVRVAAEALNKKRNPNVERGAPFRKIKNSKYAARIVSYATERIAKESLLKMLPVV